MYVACPLTETKIHITPKVMLIPPYGPSKATTTKYDVISKCQSEKPPSPSRDNAIYVWRLNSFAGRILTHSEDCLDLTCQDLTHLQAEYLHILRTV